MKKILGLSVILSGFLMTSCKTSIEASNRTVSPAFTPVKMSPKFVDYDVDLSTRKVVSVNGKLKKSESNDAFVQMAINQSIIESGADFLFDPLVSTERKGKKVTVSVSGYPAKYTKLETVNLKDSLAVDFYYSAKNINNHSKGEAKLKKNRKNKLSK